jgi:hypothetical protein
MLNSLDSDHGEAVDLNLKNEALSYLAEIDALFECSRFRKTG